MMNELCQKSIVRFTTAFRRLCKDGEEHYVMFEWADGGNLRNLWENMPSPILSGKLVKSVIEELLGLATALAAAHNLENSGDTGASYRHGDLKPENILVFKSDGPIGRLKIGDWGEAKYQGKVTAIRPSRTTTRFGTRRYEAPEVELGVRASFLGQSTKRRSRLCDIWAMGCITLEFVVWLFYGLEGLNRFNHDVEGDTFYQIRIENGKKVAQVHSAAVGWMDRMSNEPVCKVGPNALIDLLDFVRDNLLVVKLPRNLGSNLPSMDPGRYRKDSAAETSLSPQNEPALETLSIFDEETVTSNPSITITPADITTSPIESSRTPLQPEPEPRGSTRCVASVFRDSLEIKASEEEADYWEIEQHQVQVPIDLMTLVPDQSPEHIIHSLEDYRRVSAH
jgi:serine/threonine protein kinase